MAFSSQWMAELLSKCDITDIISSYMELKPKGRKMWGLCPFHGEKTASFSVSPDKQLFYCFGCHAGGSVIQFVMQIEKLNYAEAIRFLADRVHLALPDEQSDEEYLKQKARRDTIYQINKASARFFCEQFLFPNSKEAQSYAYKRGLTKEIILRFGIGYAPESWDSLKRYLSSLGFAEKDMIDAGVLVKNEEKNRVYDVYRHRLIFPIQNAAGNVLGFGGRVLDDSKPKYINTGDTPVYNKKNNLYGLNLIKQDKLTDIIIVEGYMDVVGLYKAGVTNVVASLGTALTVQQARLLKRYVSEVYIAYDGDFAGQHGMIRGLEILEEQGLSVHVIRFPDNLDPDEFVAKYGKEAFGSLKEKALTVSTFKLETMASEYDFHKEDQREKFAEAACRFIATLEPVARSRYYKLVSEKTGYPVSTLELQGGRGINKAENVYAEQGKTIKGQETDKTSQEVHAERTIILAALKSKDAKTYLESEHAQDYIETPPYKRFFEYLISGGNSVQSYIAGEGAEYAGELSRLMESGIVIVDAVKSAQDCLMLIKDLRIQKEYSELQLKLKSGVAQTDRKLLERFTELNKMIAKRSDITNGRN